jgi:cell division protein FtsB
VVDSAPPQYNPGMPHFANQTLEVVLYITAAVLILAFGYQVGRWIGALVAVKKISSKEQELFTAQKGFKQLYETELAQLKEQNTALQAEKKALTDRVEEYRKKAAGFGGLFNTGGKKADAMYALLLENEALEEALHSQNKKLTEERTDSVKEQLRAASYRRVLMSQIMNDERIKGYVQEILSDEKLLPAEGDTTAATPPARPSQNGG